MFHRFHNISQIFCRTWLFRCLWVGSRTGVCLSSTADTSSAWCAPVYRLWRRARRRWVDKFATFELNHWQNRFWKAYSLNMFRVLISVKLFQVGDTNRQMWQQVNKHKSILPYPHQISFMVDRTVEHFKIQLQKKMKKKAQEAAAAAASGSGASGGTPREVWSVAVWLHVSK